MGRKKKHKKEEEDEIEEEDRHQISFGVGSEAKRSVAAVFLFALALVILLGFFGKAGMVGTKLGDLIGLMVGWAKWTFPLFLILGGVVFLFRGKPSFYISKMVGLTAILFGITGLLHWFSDLEKMKEVASLGQGGGYIGLAIAYLSVNFLGVAGGFVVILALLLVGIIISFELTFHKVIEIFKTREKEEEEDEESEDAESEEETEEENLESENEKLPLGKEEKEEVKKEVEEEVKEKSEEEVEKEGESNIGNVRFDDDDDQDDGEKDEEEKSKKSKKKNIQNEPNDNSADSEWELPSTKLLEKSKGVAKGGDTNKNEELIEKAFHDLGIEVKRAGHQVGPAVTQYRFRPDPGERVAKIAAVSGDIALTLAKHPIRIEAPIPGQSLIGIEVPNDTRAVVCLRDSVEKEEFKEQDSKLTLALGEDVSGTHIFTDLAQMPHLLIAGSTGTGKSVCINSIITTLLYQNSPKDLKFILVDPKRVELSRYAGIPHLLTPVITDHAKVINALKWVAGEMERRYRILQDMGSQNIDSYHDKLARGETKKHTDPETGEVTEEKVERMPNVVVVVDELAELIMSQGGKEAERVIVRIAQLGRAAGIHLIVSTQRPEVRIITGLIKANINARISFKVNTQFDSRTVLDMGGAEKLLGNGDMLFKSAASPKPKRIQGVFIGEKEVEKVVKFIKSQKVEEELGEDPTKGNGEEDSSEGKSLAESLEKDLTGDSNQEDELYEAAKEEVKRAGKASASLLQRRLRVGYARAARILDLLENDGIVGPADGAKPREVYEKDNSAQYENPIEDQAERDKWQS